MSGGADYDYEYIPATMCYAAKHETNFAEMDMDTMKAMVKASNPSEVHNVAQGWSDVHKQLVGGQGGGVKGAFDAAVNEVLQSWQGDAADKFKAEAQKISKKIADSASYADYTSQAMRNAASILEQLKPDIESMEKPSAANKAVNWLEDGGSRDDSGLKRDLANPNVSTQQALDNNSGNLSAGKEQQLRMAVKMEQLGAAYVSQAKAMGTWRQRSTGRDGHEDYPGPPGGDPPPPIPMPMPTGSSGTHHVGNPSLQGMGTGPGGSSGGIKSPQLQSPHTPGISGGIGTPAPDKLTPNVHTGLESFKPPSGGSTGIGGGTGGIGGGLQGGGGIGGGVGGGAGGGSLGGSSGIGGIGGSTGLIGGAGGAKGGGGAGAGGIKGGGASGAGGAGAGAGARTGRPGMPGMGGAAGAKGAGAKGAGGGAGRGASLARQKGGVIGAGGGKAGAAGQGGSGLHRSRGGAQAGAAGSGSGSRRPAGMAGAHGAHGAKGKDSKGQNGERPDYLVEDEETWTPERNVAPKVIE
ncbi:hypothetical protein ACH4YO_36515 [Streptomyces noursei]|uniref:hypothetical protein n=1 Tax=Streptomyces noursei TaxID=1971 RepID=UPI0033C29C55